MSVLLDLQTNDPQKVAPLKKQTHCSNMNHARIMVSIQYCPSCGEKFNVHCDVKHCTDFNHASRRKDRDSYCSDCGIQLTTTDKKRF